MRLTLSQSPAASPALLLLGLSDTAYGPLALPAPLDVFGLPGITLLTSGEVVLPAITGTTGIDRGYAKVEFDLPPGHSLGTNGLPLFAQWLWFDPNDFTIAGSTAGQRFVVQ